MSGAEVTRLKGPRLQVVWRRWLPSLSTAARGAGAAGSVFVPRAEPRVLCLTPSGFEHLFWCFVGLSVFLFWW